MLFKYTKATGQESSLTVPVIPEIIFPNFYPESLPLPPQSAPDVFLYCNNDMYENDAVINGFCNKNQFLSNYYPSKVTRNGLMYQSVEAAYQASKYDGNLKLQKMFTSIGPDDSKTLAKSIPYDESFHQKKEKIMYELLLLKFSDPNLNKMLKATGGKKLIEFNDWGDDYWGKIKKDGVVVGKNRLGEFLMTIRSL